MKNLLKIAIVTCLALPAAAQDVDNHWLFSGKTNVALWGVDAIANVEAEFFLPVVKEQAFSISLPVVWSPYTVSSSWKYRVFAVQPEFRWWITDMEKWWLRERPTNTHFVGIHTHLAWFNVAVDGRDRYQGKEGTAVPLWGAGVSYGYALLLPWWKNCGAEFTLGLGYARITYDQYHNEVPNGIKYATGVKQYWGVTRLGISFVYHFN
jgi:hypothetical protein